MNTKYTYRRLSKDNAAVLLIDHQSGLVNLVQDYAPDEFRNNALALGKLLSRHLPAYRNLITSYLAKKPAA